MRTLKFREAAREVKNVRMLRHVYESDQEEFYDRYERMILKIANKMVRMGIRERFEDLVQTGAIGLLIAKERYALLSSQKKKKVRFTTYASAWIRGLMLGENDPVYTVSLEDLIDSHQTEGVSYGDLISDPNPSPEERLMLMDLWRPVEGLPPKMRQVMILRYREGNTLEEAGKAMGLTKERIRQIEAKAITLLRKRLGTYSVKKAA